MWWLKGFSVLLLISATFAQDTSPQEGPQEGKHLQDYNQEWRALGYAPPPHDTSGWIPTESEEQPLKRRRIRKRKRRPPVLSEEVDGPIPRRRRPQRLDQIKEPWEEMSEEITQKSTNRRRLTPIYEETEEVIDAKIPTFERVRDPFTALQEAEEKQKKKVDESTTKITDLKALLKQSGGLSLSEVLQERNLTLSELLKGNRQAISALVREAETTSTTTTIKSTTSATTTTTEPTTTSTTTESVKYRRLPPSIALKKDINRNFQRDHDRLSSHEVVEAQRKRLALLHSHKETKMFPDVMKMDVVTEETTERRVFVPSNPKVSTSLDYKNIDSITTAAPTTTTITTQATTPKRTRKLPMTSAKLNKLMSHNDETEETASKIPDQAVSISLNEIFGFGNLGKTDESSDGPLKMIIDLAELVTTEDPQEIENTIQTRTPFKVLEELTISTTVSISEKLKHVTAKEEIMEILKSPRDRDNLARILRTRNMTVDELVEQRERGSSQLHLADIFHNKTREPEPIDAPLVGHVKVEDFETTSSRKGKTIPIASEVITTTLPAIEIEEEITTKLPYTITSFPTYKIETNKEVKVQPFLPVWHQLYPNFFQGIYENSNIQNDPGLVQPTTTQKTNYDELERLEEIENALAEAANGRLKVDVPQNVFAENEDEDEEDFINLPSGVKSAILASLAIVGLSLLMFLTILIIFKWSQKKKTRLTYSGSFSGSRIRSPILEPNQKRTLRNFVSETLGKRKNYYKAHMQSMSDSIWDKDERKTYLA